MIRKAILSANSRVFSTEIDGVKVVVKKYEKSKKNKWHILLRIFFRLTKHPLLTPTVLSADKNSVLFETGKLKNMFSRGINVPRVLYICDDYFVMSYTGENLTDIIDKEPKRRRELIEKAIIQMALMHNAGFTHGGSQIRNFTELNGEIFSIDFEEVTSDDFRDEMRLRDVMLFIFSLQENNYDPDVAEICALYEKYAKTNIFPSVLELLLKLRWLKAFNMKIFKPWLGQDLKCAIEMVKKAEAVSADNDG